MVDNIIRRVVKAFHPDEEEEIVTRVRARGEQVRRFLLEHISAHAGDSASFTAEHFKISRQAVNKHLAHLVSEGAILPTGTTRARRYRLATLSEWHKTYSRSPTLSEDAAWRDVSLELGALPKNIHEIWQYAFTEMFNNAIDHSGGKSISVRVEKTAASTEMSILDDGVGIFKKIQTALGLVDPRHAVLELAKGKFTTDPKRHSGEGIFFSSRSLDEFQILSGEVYFRHRHGDPEDWILQPKAVRGGTYVGMRLHNHTSRRLRAVFDEFTTADGNYSFNKTIVPVTLAQYGDDNLVSRSQAKRLLVRIDRFRKVLLDFTGVATIGQSFADEIFRVFRDQHPEVELVALKTSAQVAGMISRAEANGQTGDPS
jgi:anti-sigma regulatory factor (Ser/Thr protein kinase)